MRQSWIAAGWMLVLGLALAPPARPSVAKHHAPAPATARPAAVAADDDVVFDDLMLELTPERLDAVLRGLVAAQAVADGRAGLVAQQRALEAHGEALHAAQGADIDASLARQDSVRACLAAGYRAATDGHARELRAHAQVDAAFAQQMTIFAMERAQAEARGDTAQARRLTEHFTALTAPTPAESLRVEARCGPLPALSPAAAEMDSLRAAGAEIARRVRAMDAAALPAGAKASGLDENQFTIARDRVAIFLGRTPVGPSHGAGFSAVERAALSARRAALLAALPNP